MRVQSLLVLGFFQQLTDCDDTASAGTQTDMLSKNNNNKKQQQTDRLPCLIVVTQLVLGSRQKCYQTTDKRRQNIYPAGIQTDRQTCYQKTDRPPTLYKWRHADTDNAGIQTDIKQQQQKADTLPTLFDCGSTASTGTQT